MGSSFGAGAGADMLQEVLRRKFQEVFAQQQLNQQATRDQAALHHFGAMEQEATAQTDMQRKRLEAELNPPPAPVKAPGVHVIDGNLIDDTGAVRYKRPDAPPAPVKAPGVHVVSGNLVDDTGKVIFRAPKAAGGPASQPPSAEPTITPQQQNEVTDAIKLIDQIGSDKALDTAVGPIDQYIGKARDLEGVTRFQALHDQLVGKLALAQAGKLKGQGQISDKERALLSSAATALQRGLSEQDYKNELAKIREQFTRMQAGGAAPAASPGVATPAGGPQVGETKRFPNGKTGVWDGHGWVAQ